MDENTVSSDHNSWVEVDPDKLRSLFVDLKSHQGEISSETGKKRGVLKEYYKETGHHKAGIDIVVKLDNMSDGSRADALRTLMPLLKHLNETRWAKQQPDFLDDAEENADQEDDE